MLAESWRFPLERPRSIEFLIRNDIRWSDGSPITLDHIRDSIASHSKGGARHLQALKKLVTIDVDPSNRTLVLNFSGAVGTELLHELSLADAALYPDESGDLGRWTKTSGPYFIPSGQHEGTISLKKNPFYFYAIEDAPKDVTLVHHPREEIADLFRRGALDLYVSQGNSFYPPVANTEGVASRTRWPHPTMIHYIAFPKHRKAAQSPRIRKRLRDAIYSAIQHKPLQSKYLDPFNQMVPSGFHGALPTDRDNLSTPRKAEVLKLDSNTVTIDVMTDWEGFASQLREWTQSAQADGININFTYFDLTKRKGFLDTSSDGVVMLFAGNQRDALGSWSFLAGSPDSPLGAFHAELQPLLTEAASNPAERDAKLIQLHRKVLEEAYAIPLFVERRPIFHSDRVDLSNWNLFDARIRLDEVIWKP